MKKLILTALLLLSFYFGKSQDAYVSSGMGIKNTEITFENAEYDIKHNNYNRAIEGLKDIIKYSVSDSYKMMSIKLLSGIYYKQDKYSSCIKYADLLINNYKLGENDLGDMLYLRAMCELGIYAKDKTKETLGLKGVKDVQRSADLGNEKAIDFLKHR